LTHRWGREIGLAADVGDPAMPVKHPDIRVKLVGPADDFCILDSVAKALRKAGVPAGEIDQFCDQALAATEKDLMQVCGQWVTLFRD
jgi:hypothetical protein